MESSRIFLSYFDLPNRVILLSFMLSILMRRTTRGEVHHSTATSHRALKGLGHLRYPLTDPLSRIQVPGYFSGMNILWCAGLNNTAMMSVISRIPICK